MARFRRAFALIVQVSLWLLCLCPLAVAQEQSPKPPADPRPNLLIAIADDWGHPHASILGGTAIETTAFDRIAREGALCEQAYISSPSCTPSRNAILTGQQFYRLDEGANLHSTLDVRHPNFVTLLEQAGYEVAHWRKAWGPGNAKAGGYTRNPCGPNRKFDEFLAGRDSDRPFCFWFGTSDPHRGYKKGVGRENGIDPEKVTVPPWFPDTPEVRSDIADYLFEVRRWDRDVGQAMELLEERGLLDTTLVVMTSDHGMPFPRCKGNLYDSGARVPMAMRWPERIPAGTRLGEFVSTTDLAPTFLSAAGVDVPEVMTGRSVLPLFGEGAADWRSAIVFGRERHVPAQTMPSMVGYPSRALRTQRWLLIWNLEPDRWPAGVPENGTHPIGSFADCDNGPTKTVISAMRTEPGSEQYWSWSFGKRPEFELYDCEADPGQIRNLASDPERKLTLEALRNRLVQRLQATEDPRFAGAGKAPFDDYPYRAAYLKRHIEKSRGKREGR